MYFMHYMHWKFEKSEYIGLSSSDFDEIWHGDAVRPAWQFWLLKNFKFRKSKMAAVAILKNRKITIQDDGRRHVGF